MKISKVKPNPNNPRIIKDSKFAKLVKSIKEFPKMMELRPIIVDENWVIQGGNMRYKALIELGYKEIPDEWVKQFTDLTEDQKKEFAIKDNVNFGEWDWDELANSWDVEDLKEWDVIQWDQPNFNPVYNPQTNYNDVTREDIMRTQEELANKFSQLQGNGIDVICPNCGEEFNIQP